ncbi:MAG: BCCT family transporter, partial [Pseudomonadales bacterium]|nr:BCCT family transporter [Pseudomonadales bacterium]
MSSRETVPLQFGARHYLSVFTIATLLAFSLLAALDLETANELTNQLRDATLSHFDWLFTLTASVVLLAMFALL